MISKKKVLMGLSITSMILLLGCSGKSDEVKPKELSPDEEKYNLVLAKTLKDCKVHEVILDENRASEFIHKFSKEEIEKAVSVTKELPKKNCLFIADEISEEKDEKVKMFVDKARDRCKEFGVELSAEKLTKKANKIPLFVIRKILENPNESTEQECKAMELRYK